MSKGGARLFFNTMRRQHPKCVGDDDLRNLHNYLRAHATYWLVVEEKLAPETHFHIVELTNKEQQRSNYITTFQKWCMAEWSDIERSNHRSYNRSRKSGAVLQVTSLHVITDYLDGTRESKGGDHFKVLLDNLPEDLSVLEEFIPDVGGIKQRKVNLRYRLLYHQCQQRFHWPPVRAPDKWFVRYVTVVKAIKILENEDVRECLCEPLFTGFARKFWQWVNLYSDMDNELHRFADHGRPLQEVWCYDSEELKSLSN